jgi:hypothetical protein
MGLGRSSAGTGGGGLLSAKPVGSQPWPGALRAAESVFDPLPANHQPGAAVAGLRPGLKLLTFIKLSHGYGFPLVRQAGAKSLTPEDVSRMLHTQRSQTFNPGSVNEKSPP